jgi:hypothetical protein
MVQNGSLVARAGPTQQGHHPLLSLHPKIPSGAHVPTVPTPDLAVETAILGLIPER